MTERIIYGLLAVIFLINGVYLFLQNRKKDSIIRLHVALSNIDSLKRIVKHKNNSDCRMSKEGNADDPGSLLSRNSSDGLRLRLQQELEALHKQGLSTSAKLSSEIVRSDAYQTLKDYIGSRRHIPDNSEIWDNVEAMVLGESPEFRNNIMVLTNGKITIQEYRTALLTKCNITPSEMCILFSRSKGSLSSRRAAICMKIFGEKLGTRYIDEIIRLL